MREVRHVTFNVGSDRVRDADALLLRVQLAGTAELHRGGVLAGYGRVALAADDPRLDALRSGLDSLNVVWSERLERRYSQPELDRFAYFRLIIRTAGLMGGVNLRQPYDYARACPTCGAGAQPVPPLLADLPRMGRKALDATAHDGHLVVARALADGLLRERLSGIETLPVTRALKEPADERFVWLRPARAWPPLDARTVVDTNDLCATCGLGGHFDASAAVTELWYAEYPADMDDIAYTHEYFGAWRLRGAALDRPVGGMRLPLVSQRMRRCLLTLKVRHVEFEPVFTMADAPRL